MLMQCMGNFLNNTYFLTVKGPDAKHNKIGYVNDLCRKISKTYIIVRETNKTTPGNHFHALLRLDKPPPKSWFKKGVHMNLQKVGGVPQGVTYQTPMPGLTQNEISLMYHLDDADVAIAYVEDMIFEKLKKKMKKATHIEKVLKYCSKDLNMPMQYTDYIYVVKSKQVKLTGG